MLLLKTFESIQPTYMLWRKKWHLKFFHIPRTLYPLKNLPHAFNYNTAELNLTKPNIFFLLEQYTKLTPNNPYLLTLWHYLYINHFMNQLFVNKTFTKYLNIQQLMEPNLLAYVIYGFKAIKWKRFYIIYGNEIWETLILAVWIKNLTLLMKWMKKYFESHHLRKHKRLFNLLIFLFGKLLWSYNIFFALKGVRVSMRGKFGKAGSVRKTRKYIKKGQCSYSNKNLAFVHRIIFIRTFTGTFSLTVEIFF